MKKRLALEREVQRLERTAGKELQCVCSEAIEATASSEDGLGEDGSAVEDSRRVGSSAGPSLHPPSHVRSTPCILAMLQSSNYQTLCRVVLLLLHLLQGGRHILHPRLTSAVIVPPPLMQCHAPYYYGGVDVILHVRLFSLCIFAWLATISARACSSFVGAFCSFSSLALAFLSAESEFFSKKPAWAWPRDCSLETLSWSHLY